MHEPKVSALHNRDLVRALKHLLPAKYYLCKRLINHPLNFAQGWYTSAILPAPFLLCTFGVRRSTKLLSLRTKLDSRVSSR